MRSVGGKEIICTLGPSSIHDAVIRELDSVGASLFRINLSHTKLHEVESVILAVRRITSVPICLDTEGAQIRTGDLKDEKVFLEEGQLIRLAHEDIAGDARAFTLYPPGLVGQLRPGDRLSIDWNSVVVHVLTVDHSGALTRVVTGGVIGKNKAVTCDREIRLPPLTEKDRQAIRIGLTMHVKHVALSFANEGKDVDTLRALVGPDTFLISKIETVSGIRHVEDIASRSQAVLIDRGDLSRQVPLEQIPRAQKMIIRQAKAHGVKVYVATNFLESMVTQSEPTRAEINDIFNTLLDGADGVVLAAETAIGRHPVQSVSMAGRVIRQYEQFAAGEPFDTDGRRDQPWDTARRDGKALMAHLTRLPACALITTGRTGTDFLQSLLDMHPQVLTFNGRLYFHDFWVQSKCVNSGRFHLSDFLDEFVGRHIEKLKSRYDLEERKDQLGERRDQSLDVDVAAFKRTVMELMDGQEASSRNLLVAVYAAYASCLGQDLWSKRIVFHHLHHAERLTPYLNDFPDSRIICMTRDPRANLVSGILHWRRYEPRTDRQSHLNYYLGRILRDARVLKERRLSSLVVRLEDLGDRQVLERLCQWLGIEYHACMERSTWGGLLWHADRLSTRQKDAPGFSRNLLQNQWETVLWGKDQYVLNDLMHDRLVQYGYPHRQRRMLDRLAVFFLIPLPLRFECHYWSWAYLSQRLRQGEGKTVLRNLVDYVRRVRLLYGYYFKSWRPTRWDHPLLRVESG